MAGFIVPIISSLAGLFGGGQQKQQQQTNNTTTSGTQSGTSSSSTTPELSGLQGMLSNLFGDAAVNQYRNGAPDLSGYQSSGIQQINKGSDASSKIIANTLASRGLSFSPAAATALAQPEINRTNQISSFLSTIPLLQRQFQQQNLSGLEGAFSTLPTATSTTGSASQTSNGTSNQSGTAITSGNPLAGLFGGLGAGLAGPSPSGNSTNNLNGILQSLGIGKSNPNVFTSGQDL